MEIITKYFPDLSPHQKDQFTNLFEIYQFWNEKINLISRKDFDNFYVRHVLHSIAIAKFCQFLPDTKILDLGTGGGFPGIPLAIFFPEVKFHLTDSIGKKIMVVKDVIEKIKLENVTAEKSRAEALGGSYDFIVSRAVADFDSLYTWSKHLISKNSFNELSNGWICLKGGQPENISHKKKPMSLTPVSEYFEEDFFKEKFIFYCPS